MKWMFLIVAGICLIQHERCRAQLKGRVVRVWDGDTFSIEIPETQTICKIRLYGTDCPELGQESGIDARNFTSKAILQKGVVIEVKNKDRYGRVLGIVAFSDSLILNEELLKAGWAWHDIQFDHQKAWAEHQRRAKEQGRGLWNGKGPIEPWRYRKLNKSRFK